MSGLFPTVKLLAVQTKFRRLPTFFLNWFNREIRFEEDIIAFDKVHVNYSRLAPFVAPNVQGRVLKHKGFNRAGFKPAYLKPKDVVDPNMIIPIMPGEEPPAGRLTFAQRRNAVIAHLLRQQRAMHENRWEWMAAKALTYGFVDVEGQDYPLVRVDFNRDPTLTLTTQWNAVGANTPLQDIVMMRRRSNDLSMSGAVIRDWIFGGDAWAKFYEVHEEQLLKLMDKNIRGSDTAVTRVAEDLEGVEYMGQISGLGGTGLIRIWVNTQQIENAEGQREYLFPQNGVAGVSQAVEGVRCFGAIMDSDANYQPLPYFPKNWKSEDPSAEYLMSQGAPLMVPADPNSTCLILVTDLDD